jgi:hypothetical protein
MMSERNRDKGAAAAQDLLPAGVNLRTYLVGRGHARLTTGAVVGIVIFGLVFVVGILLGHILIPGGLLLVWVITEIMPRRGVGVTTDGSLVLVSRSFWNGRPKAQLANLAPATSPTTIPDGSMTLHFGPERVHLSSGEVARLRTSLAV